MQRRPSWVKKQTKKEVAVCRLILQIFVSILTHSCEFPTDKIMGGQIPILPEN